MCTLMFKVGPASDLIKIKKKKKHILREPETYLFCRNFELTEQLLNKFLKHFLLVVLQLMQNNSCLSEVFQHGTNLSKNIIVL